MAQLIDTDGEIVGESTTVDYDDLIPQGEEAQVAPEPAPQVEPEPAEDTSDLPEKYQGKTVAEIARMHQEAERRIGEQGAEVGSLRQAFDEMVRANLSAPKQQQTTPEVEEVSITEADFFADPVNSANRLMENHPMFRQMQEQSAQLARQTGLAQLQAQHPDMKETLTSDGFKSWVNKSSFRRSLFDRADAEYDFAACSELLTLYKEAQGVAKTVATVEKAAQKSAVKKASTGTSRSSAEGTRARKVYKRSDIIELAQRDPRRYEAMADEILQAYAEGRVVK